MNSAYDNSGSGRPDSAGARIFTMLDGIGQFLGRIGFGLFLLLAVGATLVATTFVGILLALAAGILTFTHRLGRRKGGAASAGDGPAETNAGPPPTLDAHRTADGWVTEPVRSD